MSFEKKSDFVIESTPKIEKRECKIKLFLFYFLITVLPFLLVLYIWYEYDWMIAFGSGIFLYFIHVIILSKIRLLSLPKDQMERSFSSLDVLKWYIHRYHCMQSYPKKPLKRLFWFKDLIKHLFNYSFRIAIF